MIIIICHDLWWVGAFHLKCCFFFICFKTSKTRQVLKPIINGPAGVDRPGRWAPFVRHSKHTKLKSQWKMSPQMTLDDVGICWKFAQIKRLYLHVIRSCLVGDDHLAAVVAHPAMPIQDDDMHLNCSRVSIMSRKGCGIASFCPRPWNLVANLWSCMLYSYTNLTPKKQESIATKVTILIFSRLLGMKPTNLPDLRTDSLTLPKGILPGFQLEANPPQAEFAINLGIGSSRRFSFTTTRLADHGCCYFNEVFWIHTDLPSDRHNHPKMDIGSLRTVYRWRPQCQGPDKRTKTQG